MAEVFVVDRGAFFAGSWPQGFTALAGTAAGRFLTEALARGRFEPRPVAEQTPAWKQLIPYCVIRSVDPESGRPLGVFRVRRTSGQGETRLHGKWSIGLGGHVEPADRLPETAGAEAFFATALARELLEELDLQQPLGSGTTFLGLLNDDQTPVGAVHAGLVYRLDLPVSLATARELVRVREISKMYGGFGSLVEFANLWQDPRRFETWSQFLVQAGVVGRMDASVDSSVDSRAVDLQTDSANPVSNDR